MAEVIPDWSHGLQEGEKLTTWVNRVRPQVAPMVQDEPIGDDDCELMWRWENWQVVVCDGTIMWLRYASAGADMSSAPEAVFCLGHDGRRTRELRFDGDGDPEPAGVWFPVAAV